MSYGLDPNQFVRHIIRPILTRLVLWSPAAEVLVLGTALVESGLRYVDQVDKRDRPGPAFGLWQTEGATHADHYHHHLNARPELKRAVLRLAGSYSGDFPDPGEMVWNMGYACAICRIDYLRAPALPPAKNAAAMAAFHKAHYNSALGATKVDESIRHFEFAIQLEV